MINDKYRQMTNNEHKLTFNEKISIPHAKALLRLSKSEFIRSVYDSTEPDKFGKKKTDAEMNTYIKNLRQYLRLSISKNGCVSQTYKYQKGMEQVQAGRIYVNHFGVQSLQSKVRGFLCNDIYNDFDMTNCFPTLLLWFCKNYFPDLPIKYLEAYVKNRDSLLKSFNTTKVAVIVQMNTDTRYIGNNKLLKKLSREFGQIQTAFWSDTENELLQQVDKDLIKTTNKKGSFLSRILGIIENEILQEVTKKFDDNIGVPYYDGAFINANLDIQETLETLNKITEDYEVKWTHKPHKTLNIEVCDNEDIFSDEDEDEPENLYGHEFISYEDLKKIFEETGKSTHSVIQTPIMYVKQYYDYYSYDNKKRKVLRHEMYTQSQLTELYRNLYYQELKMTSDGKGGFFETIQDCKFITSWLDDADRKTMLKIDFVPESKFKICPDDVYNIFKGFQSRIIPNNNPEAKDVIDRFINHISLLCGHEEKATNYVLDYISDMIQNPHSLPMVALIFKSKQGLGKDLMINYIEKMLGEEYVFRTSDITRDIFGTFNPAVRGKLLVQFNELQGREGFAHKERFKDFITADKLNINEKNVKQFTIKNSIRPIVFSNNLNPIEIPADDRRFVVLKGGDLLPEEKRNDYYNPLFDNLNNPVAIDYLYSYFMERDISQLDLKRQRPITQAYKNMKDSNTPPLTKYLYELLTSEESLVPMKESKKEKGKFVVPVTKFLNNYQSWYAKVYKEERFSKKATNDMLLDMKFSKKRVEIKGQGRCWTYQFNKEDTIEMLERDYELGQGDGEELEEFDFDSDIEDFLD